MLLSPEGQTDTAWEPSMKQWSFGNCAALEGRVFHFSFQLVRCWPLTAAARVRSRSFYAEICIWTKWHWNRSFSKYFSFPLSVSFHRCYIRSSTFSYYYMHKRAKRGNVSEIGELRIQKYYHYFQPITGITLSKSISRSPVISTQRRI